MVSYNPHLFTESKVNSQCITYKKMVLFSFKMFNKIKNKRDNY